jgi:hypothetical protein
MHHTPDTFSCLPAEHSFPTSDTDLRRDILHQNGIALDLKDLADNLQARFMGTTDVTMKHGYLRRV